MALDFQYWYKHEHLGNACFIKEMLSEAKLLEILTIFVIHFMVGKGVGKEKKEKGKKEWKWKWK